MNEIVFAAMYNPMIHESTFGIISLHKTRKGAEMALEFHREEKRKEWNEMYSDVPIEERYGMQFGQFEAWNVFEYTLEL